MADAVIVCPFGTLVCMWTGTPAARLNSFEPAGIFVGQTRRLLKNGELRGWNYREADGDFTADFEIRDIADDQQELCVRLGLHLGGGGVVEVQTGDLANRTYPRCQLAPGATAPQPKLSDPVASLRTMSFSLLNLDGAPFLAIY